LKDAPAALAELAGQWWALALEHARESVLGELADTRQSLAAEYHELRVQQQSFADEGSALHAKATASAQSERLALTQVAELRQLVAQLQAQRCNDCGIWVSFCSVLPKAGQLIRSYAKFGAGFLSRCGGCPLQMGHFLRINHRIGRLLRQLFGQSQMAGSRWELGSQFRIMYIMLNIAAAVRSCARSCLRWWFAGLVGLHRVCPRLPTRASD